MTTALRRASIALGASLLALTGCTTQSPPDHGTRLQKAAGLKEFRIQTSESLWETTNDSKNGTVDHSGVEAKAKSLENGLREYTLDGVNLATYLRRLDYEAHGGAGAFKRYHRPEATRMYDEIAKTLDAVKKRPAADEEPPTIVVDTAFVDSKD